MAAISSLQIRLLGEFQMRLAPDSHIELPTRKAKCLLAYLACHPGESLPRERLVGLFWGGSEEKRAQHNLRQTLTYLRKSLGSLDPSPIESGRTTVRLKTRRPDNRASCRSMPSRSSETFCGAAQEMRSVSSMG